MYFQFFCPDELNSPHWIPILGGPILFCCKTPEKEKIHLFLHHLIYARLISVTEGREHAPFYVLLNYFLSLEVCNCYSSPSCLFWLSSSKTVLYASRFVRKNNCITIFDGLFSLVFLLLVWKEILKKGQNLYQSIKCF